MFLAIPKTNIIATMTQSKAGLIKGTGTVRPVMARPACQSHQHPRNGRHMHVMGL